MHFILSYSSFRFYPSVSGCLFGWNSGIGARLDEGATVSNMLAIFISLDAGGGGLFEWEHPSALVIATEQRLWLQALSFILYFLWFTPLMWQITHDIPSSPHIPRGCELPQKVNHHNSEESLMGNTYNLFRDKTHPARISVRERVEVWQGECVLNHSVQMMDAHLFKKATVMAKVTIEYQSGSNTALCVPAYLHLIRNHSLRWSRKQHKVPL